jgi:hypothetical protein
MVISILVSRAYRCITPWDMMTVPLNNMASTSKACTFLITSLLLLVQINLVKVSRLN